MLQVTKKKHQGGSGEKCDVLVQFGALEENKGRNLVCPEKTKTRTISESMIKSTRNRCREVGNEKEAPMIGRELNPNPGENQERGGGALRGKKKKKIPFAGSSRVWAYKKVKKASRQGRGGKDQKRKL